MFPNVDTEEFVLGMGIDFRPYRLQSVRPGSGTHCVMDLVQSGREFAHSVVVVWNKDADLLRLKIQEETLIPKEDYAWLLMHLAENFNVHNSTSSSRFAIADVGPRHIYLSLDVNWTMRVPDPNNVGRKRLGILRSLVKEQIIYLIAETDEAVRLVNQRHKAKRVH